MVRPVFDLLDLGTCLADRPVLTNWTGIRRSKPGFVGLGYEKVWLSFFLPPWHTALAGFPDVRGHALGMLMAVISTEIRGWRLQDRHTPVIPWR
jgi:hypothetical protein